MLKSEKRPSKIVSRTTAALIVSLLVHFTFVLISFIAPQFSNQEDTTIEIALDENNSLEYLKEVDPKRLVEFDQTNNQKDDKAKYLAAKDNTVKKETVARLDTQFKNIEKSKSAATPKSETRAENQWEKKADNSPKAKLFNTGFDVYEKMNEKTVAQQKRVAAAASAADSSTSTDRLEGVDQSLMTQLNTKEYKYYGYYTRIRQQLNQWWQPKVKEKVSKLMSKGRTIASDQNKNTRVIIVLDDVGSLVKVQVLGASGVRELDDAAVEAFRQAAPFPNPPKGIIDVDGTIKIRWDFIVES